MPTPTLPEILKPYGIETPKALARVLKCTEDYARRLWKHKTPVSLKMAVRLKEFTGAG